MRKEAAALSDQPVTTYQDAVQMGDCPVVRHLHAVTGGYPMWGLQIALGRGDVPLQQCSPNTSGMSTLP